ncbi:MAG: hypothetical protein QXE78_03705 [Nitrososphaeria archaeon]
MYNNVDGLSKRMTVKHRNIVWMNLKDQANWEDFVLEINKDKKEKIKELSVIESSHLSKISSNTLISELILFCLYNDDVRNRFKEHVIKKFLEPKEIDEEEWDRRVEKYKEIAPDEVEPEIDRKISF